MGDIETESGMKYRFTGLPFDGMVYTGTNYEEFVDFLGPEHVVSVWDGVITAHINGGITVIPPGFGVGRFLADDTLFVCSSIFMARTWMRTE